MKFGGIARCREPLVAVQTIELFGKHVIPAFE